MILCDKYNLYEIIYLDAAMLLFPLVLKFFGEPLDYHFTLSVYGL